MSYVFKLIVVLTEVKEMFDYVKFWEGIFFGIGFVGAGLLIGVNFWHALVMLAGGSIVEILWRAVRDDKWN